MRVHVWNRPRIASTSTSAGSTNRALAFVRRRRRGDAGILMGTNRIRGGPRPFLGVLVEVDEAAAPLFLPPLARGKLRRPPLDFARERKRCLPNLVKAPQRLNA